VNQTFSRLRLYFTICCSKAAKESNGGDDTIKDVLHPNLNVDPYNLPDVHYHSIIGKLNFLAQHTQSNIANMVNSCAWYLNSPSKSHFTAVKRIGCYLLGTRDKGLILHPTNENCLNAYVVSDFTRSWSKQTSHLCHAALSQTSYFITFSGCLIHWVSKI